MDYMTTKDAAREWNITPRRVSILCAENRIPDVLRFNGDWAIPKSAQKPIDARCLRPVQGKNLSIRPFVKWAGGKGQLLDEIRKEYPSELGKSITKYAEPFVGGGAVLFDVLSKYQLKSVYISDTNAELINTYKMVRDNVNKLLEELSDLKDKYVPMNDAERHELYYEKRERFNELKMNGNRKTDIEKAVLFVFLNKTCFNGLYRVNRKGQFNVPIGAYKKPLICDEDNLRNISKALSNVEIVGADYRESKRFIDDNTFVYFDPPYRPLTETASFTAYTESLFDDAAQRELAEFVAELDKKGAKVVVSNSDPKNSNTDDDFLDRLYSRHRIRRVEASRMINCNSEMRGKISELLIANY
ncbi:MAG: DNA adenine methylase [Oscillospiraceae bacterium]|nr:DNA adenine methylase [Oscillospiraceae bacterium]